MMTLAPMMVLFARSQDAFPKAPTFSQLLTHRDARVLAGKASATLNWPLL